MRLAGQAEVDEEDVPAVGTDPEEVAGSAAVASVVVGLFELEEVGLLEGNQKGLVGAVAYAEVKARHCTRLDLQLLEQHPPEAEPVVEMQRQAGFLNVGAVVGGIVPVVVVADKWMKPAKPVMFG